MLSYKNRQVSNRDHIIRYSDYRSNILHVFSEFCSTYIASFHLIQLERFRHSTMDFNSGSRLSFETARLLRGKCVVDNKYFHIKSISCVDIIKRNSMSTLIKFSSFPKTVELGCFVFPGLLCGAAALNQPGLLSSGVTSSRGADGDKLSFATYLFPRIHVFSHNWPYTLLALHRLNRRDRFSGDLHS